MFHFDDRWSVGRPLACAAALMLSLCAHAQPTPPSQDYVAALGVTALRAPATADFVPATSLTMEGWIYVTGRTPYGWLMGKGLATAGADPFVSFALQLDGTGNKLIFVCSTGMAGSYRELASPTSVPLRTWTHVAAVLDSGTMRLLVNGAQVASGTAAGALLAAPSVAFGVGSAFLANGNTNYPAFPGYARQVRFWNVARTAAQIAAAMGESLPTDRTGLVAAWPLDESSGSTARDLSGANRALTGGSWARRTVLEAGPFFDVTTSSPAGGVLAEVDDAILIDFDSDGDADLVTTHIRVPATVPETRLRLRAFRNTGGAFADVTDTVLGNVTMVHPRHRWVADFNGDGRMDLLVVGHGTDTPPFPGEQAKLFIQTADHRLADETATRLPQHNSFTHNVAVGDIDEDGDPDLYLANINGGVIGPLFYLNDGAGGFSEVLDRLPADIAARTAGLAYTSAALADVNGDGHADLVLGGENTGPNELLLNDGTGRFARNPQFTIPPKLFGNTAVTVAVEAADLNADGAVDLVLSTTGGQIVMPDGRTINGYQIPGVQLLLNRGDGTFVDASAQLNVTFAATDTWIEWIRVVDMNADGRPDLVLQGAPTAGGQAFSRTLLLNCGNGVFIDASEAYTGGVVTFLEPTDVDRDGRMDLVGVGNQIVVSRATKVLALAVFRPATGTPAVSGSPTSQSIIAGGAVQLTVAASGTPAPVVQWERNGRAIAGATATTYSVAGVRPSDAGVYRASVVNAAGSSTSNHAVLGVSTTSKVIGAGEEIGANITHSNGNVFDQVAVTGAAEAITADFTANQITRTSFIDADNDIVQVEFSGPGTLSLVLDTPSGPALPVNYNQNFSYMKGHAGIVITGADERTNLSVFTVGRATAVNQALFKEGVSYDGFADIAFVAIQSSNGRFGGVRTANATYFASQGLTGLYAPGVTFEGPVYLGDITAFDEATPVLVIGGANGNTWITGGDLRQDNGRAVQVSGLTQLHFKPGSDSHGHTLPAQANQARLEQNGVDVTTQVVVNP